MGCLFAQAQEAKELEEPEYRKALHQLYLAAQQINRLAIICNWTTPGPVHFSIASGNELQQTSKYVARELGLTDIKTLDVWK